MLKMRHRREIDKDLHNSFSNNQGGERSADPLISADVFHEFRAIFRLPQKIVRGVVSPDNFPQVIVES